jgi:hypothetical protein
MSDMTIENCNVNAKVQTTYDRLVQADGRNIRDVFDAVFDDMRSSTRQDKMQFVQLLNQKLELSGKLPQVLVATAEYEFDKINDGHSRIKDRALKDKAQEFHNEDRLLEESFVNDLLQSENLMKKEKHEGKFLGMGNKGGVDLARLETHVAKNNDRLDAEDALRAIGTDQNWQEITQGRGYLTRGYIAHRLNQNLVTHDLASEQQTALQYLGDKHNFKRASKDVPICNTGCAETTSYERRITQSSLENFVGKKFAGTDYEYADDDPIRGVKDRKGAGWRAIADYDQRADNYVSRRDSIDQQCAQPSSARLARPIYRRPVPETVQQAKDCGCDGPWSDTFPSY